MESEEANEAEEVVAADKLIKKKSNGAKRSKTHRDKVKVSLEELKDLKIKYKDLLNVNLELVALKKKHSRLQQRFLQQTADYTDKKFTSIKIMLCPNSITISETPIGSGTFGNVYSTRNKKYALKFFKKEYLDSFLTEANALNDISMKFDAENNIVNYQGVFFLGSRDSFQEDDKKYFIKLKRENCSLSEWFKQSQFKKSLDINKLNLVRQLLKSVDWLHSTGGYIHRDIKPANILVRMGVETEITLLLADFGTAFKISEIEHKVDDSCFWSTDVTTLQFRAPEMLDHQQYNQTVDYWSVGIVVHDIFFPDEYYNFLEGAKTRNSSNITMNRESIQKTSVRTWINNVHNPPTFLPSDDTKTILAKKSTKESLKFAIKKYLLCYNNVRSIREFLDWFA